MHRLRKSVDEKEQQRQTADRDQERLQQDLCTVDDQVVRLNTSLVDSKKQYEDEKSARSDLRTRFEASEQMFSDCSQELRRWLQLEETELPKLRSDLTDAQTEQTSNQNRKQLEDELFLLSRSAESLANPKEALGLEVERLEQAKDSAEGESKSLSGRLENLRRCGEEKSRTAKH